MLSLIACCDKLIVILENHVQDKWGTHYEGVYTFQGISQGMDYWVDAEGLRAIWYTEYGMYPRYYVWNIGFLSRLGTLNNFYFYAHFNKENSHGSTLKLD